MLFKEILIAQTVRCIIEIYKKKKYFLNIYHLRNDFVDYSLSADLFLQQHKIILISNLSETQIYNSGFSLTFSCLRKVIFIIYFYIAF